MDDFSGRRFISVKDAALYLSVHEMTLRTWINEKRIKAIRIGRAVRVDLRSLNADLEAQLAGQPADRRGRR